jgi:hypothetical protein
MKNKVYKFIYTKPVYIQTNLKDREFENEWIKIHKGGKIKVKCNNKEGYAWDGCSFKFNFIDITWGTPDGKLDFKTKKPITYYASLLHDVIYQFKTEIPISRKEADLIFKEILKLHKFKLTKIYYFFVRLFGGIYGDWKCRKSEKVKITDVSWL